MCRCVYNYYILVETMMIISFVSRRRRVFQTALTGCERRGHANLCKNVQTMLYTQYYCNILLLRVTHDTMTQL